MNKILIIAVSAFIMIAILCAITVKLCQDAKKKSNSHNPEDSKGGLNTFFNILATLTPQIAVISFYSFVFLGGFLYILVLSKFTNPALNSLLSVVTLIIVIAFPNIAIDNIFRDNSLSVNDRRWCIFISYLGIIISGIIIGIRISTNQNFPNEIIIVSCTTLSIIISLFFPMDCLFKGKNKFASFKDQLKQNFYGTNCITILVCFLYLLVTLLIGLTPLQEGFALICTGLTIGFLIFLFLYIFILRKAKSNVSK